MKFSTSTPGDEKDCNLYLVRKMACQKMRLLFSKKKDMSKDDQKRG